MTFYPWVRLAALYDDNRHLNIFDRDEPTGDVQAEIAEYLAEHVYPTSIIQRFAASFGFVLAADGLTVVDEHALRLAYVLEQTGGRDIMHYDEDSDIVSLVNILGFHDAKAMSRDSSSLADLADLVAVFLGLPHDGDIRPVTDTEMNAMRVRADEWMRPQHELPLAA